MEAKKTAPVAKPPSITQTGPKIFYEYHIDGNFVFKPEDLNMSDGYFIREARNCTFEFQGKIKNIFVENCRNVKITCKDIISVVEIVNTNRVTIYCNGRVPAIQIDGSMDVNVHLSEESKGTKIVSSKSSQMNVHFMGLDKEIVSEAIPAQFESTVVNGKLVTLPAELV